MGPEEELLEYDRNPWPGELRRNGRIARKRDRLFVDENGAGRRRVEKREAPKEHTLPASARSDNCSDRPGFDLDIDPMEDFDITEALPYLLAFEHLDS